MKRLGILSIAITLSTLGTAFANLPDEINYSPYENQYQTLSANVDRITSELNSAEDDLATGYSDEQSISDTIIEFENANQEIRSEISNAQDNLSNLRDTELDLEDKVDKLSRRSDRLTKKERQLEREIRREDSRLEPMRRRLIKVRRERKQAKAQLEIARSSVNSAQDRVKTAKSSLKTLRSQKQTLKTKLDGQKKQLATIDTQIATIEASKAELPAKIKAAKKVVKTQNDKLTTLNQELTTQRAELTEIMSTNRRDPRVLELRKALAAKAREVRSQTIVVQQAKASVEGLKSQRQTLNQRITRLAAQKQTLPAQIQRTKTAINANKASIETQKVKVSDAETAVTRSQGEFEKVQAVLVEAKNKVERVRARLDRESTTLAELATERSNVQTRLNNVIRKLKARNSDLAQTRSSIRGLENYIPQQRRTLRANESQISKMENDLRVVRDDIVALNRAVNNLSSEQQAEISKRDRKYQEYIGRYNFYKQNLDSAKELGASQTGIATDLALDSSNNYVAARSSSLGNSMGAKQATVEGNYWASVRAELKGHADGYQIGIASEADISRGETDGERAGIQGANDYATQILKPQFFNQYFASDLSQSVAPMNKEMTSSMLSLSSDEIELGVNKTFNFSNVVQPISNGELRSSRNLVTPLDTVIVQFQTNYLDISNQVQDLSRPQNAYEAPTNIPFGTPNCNNVYKGVAEYKSACASSYTAKFENVFRTVFYDNFSAQYKEMYMQTLGQKRDSLIESIYNSSFSKHYVTAENSGISDGKRDVYAKTYARAKEMAYNKQLPVATQNVQQIARTEVTNWIQSNATLKINGARIEGSKLRGNTRGKLVLSLKNISPQDLANPVKVIITDVRNATVPQREYYIRVAPGKQLSEFRDIEFLVNSRARSNQEIKVSGQIVLSGGKYQARRVETFSATAVTAVNPAVSSQLKYDSSPKVVSGFRRRTLIHNFETLISPAVESVRSGYLVTMQAAQGYQGMIKFKNTSFRTNGMNYGNSQNIKFRYTFPKSSKDKIVKVLVKYSYDGEVIKTDLVELRPH